MLGTVYEDIQIIGCRSHYASFAGPQCHWETVNKSAVAVFRFYGGPIDNEENGPGTHPVEDYTANDEAEQPEDDPKRCY